MIDFRSGLWTNKQGSHCMWEKEKPEWGDEELGFFFNDRRKEWQYDETGTSSDDYQIADFHLTSWA